MLQSKLFVKKKSYSFTPLQESPNANPKLHISKVEKRGHLGHLKQIHIHHMLKIRTQGLLVDNQSSQSTDEDKLKSPYCGAVICKIALFENPAISNFVVLSEVLEDVISRNMSVYYRIKVQCTNATKNFFAFYSEHHRDAYVEEKVEESPNDRTDRAIRVSTHWYQSHLDGSIQILLITNNRESKKKSIEDGLSSETVESYVRSLQQPNLLDLVAIQTSLDILIGQLDDLRLSKREVIYPEHKPASEILNRYNPLVGYVGDEIVICNKAFGGDVVAVELLPQCQRTEEKSLIVEDVNGNVDDAPRNANIAKAWAGSRPTVSSCSLGRVIGIIKRIWSFRKIDPLTIDLHNLNSSAMLMRQRQIESGALTLESIEVKFQMDAKTHDPLDIGIYPIREAKSDDRRIYVGLQFFCCRNDIEAFFHRVLCCGV